MKKNRYKILSLSNSVNDKKNLRLRLSFLKTVIISGSYNISSEKIAEDFLADQLLYLII